MADGYTFTKRSAQRITRVVRDVERRGGPDQPPIKMRIAAGGDGGEVRLGKTVSAWAKDSSQLIQIWDHGDPLEESLSSPLAEVTAYNRMYPVAACVWVLIAQEKHGWYLVEAATPDESEGCESPNISGHDLTTVSGYASNKKQALTHDENGCLVWVDIEECG